MSFTRCQRKIRQLTIIVRILIIVLVIAAATIIALAAREPEVVIEYEPIVIEKIMEVPVPEAEPEIVPEKITVSATAYCACSKCCGIWSAEHPTRIGTGYVQTTYTGTIPTEGRTIAVDPDVIPLGSVVIIDGNEYVAEDIGGAINGNEIDMYFDSHQAALEFGRQEIIVEVVK